MYERGRGASNGSRDPGQDGVSWTVLHGRPLAPESQPMHLGCGRFGVSGGTRPARKPTQIRAGLERP
jgi:hypothetical protein